jgi:hypothetical protein
VKNENIDIVVSDNRYGFYADAAHNVFITHQLTVLMPNGLAMDAALGQLF